MLSIHMNMLDVLLNLRDPEPYMTASGGRK